MTPLIAWIWGYLAGALTVFFVTGHLPFLAFLGALMVMFFASYLLMAKP